MSYVASDSGRGSTAGSATAPLSGTAGGDAGFAGRRIFAFFAAVFAILFVAFFAAARDFLLGLRARADFFFVFAAARLAGFFFFAMRSLPPSRLRRGVREQWISSPRRVRQEPAVWEPAGSHRWLGRVRWEMVDVERGHHTSVKPAAAIVKVGSGTRRFVDISDRHSCRNQNRIR
jgi:hypothetical protein